MENKRAVLHIYNSVSRDNFEQYALRICGYAVNTYAASTLKDKGISEEDTKGTVPLYQNAPCSGCI